VLGVEPTHGFFICNRPLLFWNFTLYIYHHMTNASFYSISATMIYLKGMILMKLLDKMNRSMDYLLAAFLITNARNTFSHHRNIETNSKSNPKFFS